MSKLIFLNDNLPAPSSQRGIWRYFDNLKAAVAGEFPGQVALCSDTSENPYKFKFYSSPRFKGSYRLKLHDRIASQYLRLAKPRVVYSSYFGVARTTATAAEIFTSHDMIPEKFWLPQRNSSANRNFVLEKQACFIRAAAVLADSESTARDFKTLYPNLAHKVVVVLLGVDPFFFKPSPPSAEPPTRPYFLYVGARGGYKNFITLLSAYGQSGLSDDFDLRVISPGPDGFNTEETALIQKWRLDGKVQLFRSVGNEELRRSYAGAAAFVYPSRYEGFGLPILEAFASATLVATSNVSSMPEVGGDAAFYFDPNSPESLVATLKQLAVLPASDRQQRIEDGQTRARTFTWERFQRQTAEVFKRFV